LKTCLHCGTLFLFHKHYFGVEHFFIKIRCTPDCFIIYGVLSDLAWVLGVIYGVLSALAWVLGVIYGVLSALAWVLGVIYGVLSALAWVLGELLPGL
jgi:hypothetical protein